MLRFMAGVAAGSDQSFALRSSPAVMQRLPLLSSASALILPWCARTRCTSCPDFRFQQDSQPRASPHKQQPPSVVTASVVRGTGSAAEPDGEPRGELGLEAGSCSCITQSPMSISHTCSSQTKYVSECLLKRRTL